MGHGTEQAIHRRGGADWRLPLRTARTLTFPNHTLGRRGLTRCWPFLVGVIALTSGCASTSAFNQNFVEVRTPNFHITSSLGDGPTRDLVRDLEVFHAGVLFALGLDKEDRSAPATLVLAFDGRGAIRPFAVRGAAAYLVPATDAPLLVVRTTGGFRTRVDSELRHRYAHRVLRDRSLARLPVWYEEGRSQIARTVRVYPLGAEVGRIDPDFRARLLDWRRSDWREVLAVRDLSAELTPARERFAVRAWALLHMLLFDRSYRGNTAVLDSVRRAFEAGDAGSLADRVADFGSNDELKARVYAHLERDEHRVGRMRVEGIPSADLVLSRLRPEIARDRLGGLALALGRPQVAREYFERALEVASDDPSALAGLALATARASESEETEALIKRAGSVAKGDADALARLGHAFVALAEGSESSDVRGDRLDSARQMFDASLTVDENHISALIGMGKSFLSSGGREGTAEDSERARKSFERVKRLRPGALEVDLLLARAAHQSRRPRTALPYLGEVLSRSHSTELRNRAKQLFDSIQSAP